MPDAELAKILDQARELSREHTERSAIVYRVQYESGEFGYWLRFPREVETEVDGYALEFIAEFNNGFQRKGKDE